MVLNRHCFRGVICEQRTGAQKRGQRSVIIGRGVWAVVSFIMSRHAEKKRARRKVELIATHRDKLGKIKKIYSNNFEL